MGKIIVFALLLAMVLLPASVYAADWSEYESGRNNIRLDGYKSMPGYIVFYDGDGNIQGYIWMSPDRGLLWCSPGAIDLTTTKLSDALGVRVSGSYTGAPYAD